MISCSSYRRARKSQCILLFAIQGLAGGGTGGFRQTSRCCSIPRGGMQKRGGGACKWLVDRHSQTVVAFLLSTTDAGTRPTRTHACHAHHVACRINWQTTFVLLFANCHVHLCCVATTLHVCGLNSLLRVLLFPQPFRHRRLVVIVAALADLVQVPTDGGCLLGARNALQTEA